MTYKTALNKTHELGMSGSIPGLERLNILLNEMGNPQYNLNFVHVAGTNGKGSVCTMLSYILEKANYKTGLFLSPFITDFRERIQINNELINKLDYAIVFNKVYPYVEKLKKENIIITEFEFVCALAYQYFYDENCDIVVLETGMGGRFDATNTIKTPLCSVITNISLDHTQQLGTTIKDIAFEKSGIIKENGLTVISSQEKEAKEEIIKNAKNKNNKVILSESIKLKSISSTLNSNIIKYKGSKISLNLIGNYQVDNAKTVIATVETLNKYKNYNIDNRAIKLGFESVVHPGRLEVLQPNPYIILDGAHNPSGMRALEKTIKNNNLNKDDNLVCILGMLKDKDINKSLSYLKNLFSTIITVPVDNPRSLSEVSLASMCKGIAENIVVEKDVEKAFDNAYISKSFKNSNIIVCGSLYLVGQIRPYILKKLKEKN